MALEIILSVLYIYYVFHNVLLPRFSATYINLGLFHFYVKTDISINLCQDLLTSYETFLDSSLHTNSRRGTSQEAQVPDIYT
jgi:hypothetical protein